MSERHDGVLTRLAERVEAEPGLEGALLLGSFATKSADELSDLDVLVVVREGRFDEAWSARSRLEGGEALSAWDDLDPERDEIGGHKWLTRDLVLVECLLATASSGVRLAEPNSVLVGDASLPDRLDRRAVMTRRELDEFADARRAAGRVHAVEAAYHGLVQAVRSSRTGR